jgi:hypothetical protein
MSDLSLERGRHSGERRSAPFFIQIILYWVIYEMYTRLSFLVVAVVLVISSSERSSS